MLRESEQFITKTVRQLGVYASSRFCDGAKPLPANLELLQNVKEPGILSQPAEAIIVLDSSAIAGGGPATWALNNQEFLSILAKDNKIPFVKVATSSGKPSFASNKLTGEYLKPTYRLEYPQDCSVEERFRITTKAAVNVVRDLAKRCVTKIFSLSEGYPGYGPLTLTMAARQVSKETGLNICMNIAYQDNCVPDSDTPSWDIAPSGFPSDRFFPGAYCGIPNKVEIFSIGTFSSPVAIGAEKKRADNYPGLQYIETAYNFTTEYMARLKCYYSELDETKARNSLIKSGLTLPKDLSIPIVSSLGNGVYWQKQSWMTDRQQQDVLRGTKTIIEALNITSSQIKKPVALVIAEEAIPFIKVNCEVVFDESQLNGKSGVLVIPRHEIKQNNFLALKKIARFEFGRSRGNNAVAESAVLEKPVIVVAMPDNNYMGVTQMDPDAINFGLPYFKPDDNPEIIADIATRLITNQSFALSLGVLENNTFTNNYKNNNFFKVLEFLTGLNKN